MAHVYIEEIGKHEGEEVTIKGWLHNRRSSGKIHFLILRDGTGFIQGVMSKAAVADLQQWLADAGVTLRSVHAPTAERFVSGVWGGSMSIASVDPDLRARAVREAEQALYIARRIPIAVLVTHVGIPRMQPRDADVGAQDVRAAARRSVEELQRAAEPLGVRIAVEVIPDIFRTVGNVTGDMALTAMLARRAPDATVL